MGTVILVHGEQGLEVEFGDLLAIVSLEKSQVRPIGTREIVHARQVAA